MLARTVADGSSALGRAAALTLDLTPSLPCSPLDEVGFRLGGSATRGVQKYLTKEVHFSFLTRPIPDGSAPIVEAVPAHEK